MSILRYKKYALADGGVLRGGSSGGGSSAPTQSTTVNTNVPEYARPYVENMLASTQSQIYNSDQTGFRPYQPYSTNPNDYVAGFSPLQQQAQQGAANLTTLPLSLFILNEYILASFLTTISVKAKTIFA